MRPLQNIVLGLASMNVFIMPLAHAEKADQDKPLILEAEKVSVNDVQQT